MEYQDEISISQLSQNLLKSIPTIHHDYVYRDMPMYLETIFEEMPEECCVDEASLENYECLCYAIWTFSQHSPYSIFKYYKYRSDYLDEKILGDIISTLMERKSDPLIYFTLKRYTRAIHIKDVKKIGANNGKIYFTKNAY